MMESLLHTDRVSVEKNEWCSGVYFALRCKTSTHNLNKFVFRPKSVKCTLSSDCTFVVEDALHLHGGPGVGDAEHGAGHQALQGRGAVCGPDQAPVWPVVAALQDLHCLTAPHRQLVAVAGHEFVYHHSQLTATRELRGKTVMMGNELSRQFSDNQEKRERHLWLSACMCMCFYASIDLPCRCPVCSVKCGRPERWCLVGCCLHPDCPGPLHP